jgi:hypothetical protein
MRDDSHPTVTKNFGPSGTGGVGHQNELKLPMARCILDSIQGSEKSWMRVNAIECAEEAIITLINIPGMLGSCILAVVVTFRQRNSEFKYGDTHYLKMETCECILNSDIDCMSATDEGTAFIRRVTEIVNGRKGEPEMLSQWNVLNDRFVDCIILNGCCDEGDHTHTACDSGNSENESADCGNEDDGGVSGVDYTMHNYQSLNHRWLDVCHAPKMTVTRVTRSDDRNTELMLNTPTGEGVSAEQQMRIRPDQIPGWSKETTSDKREYYGDPPSCFSTDQMYSYQIVSAVTEMPYVENITGLCGISKSIKVAVNCSTKRFLNHIMAGCVIASPSVDKCHIGKVKKHDGWFVTSIPTRSVQDNEINELKFMIGGECPGTEKQFKSLKPSTIDAMKSIDSSPWDSASILNKDGNDNNPLGMVDRVWNMTEDSGWSERISFSAHNMDDSDSYYKRIMTIAKNQSPLFSTLTGEVSGRVSEEEMDNEFARVSQAWRSNGGQMPEIEYDGLYDTANQDTVSDPTCCDKELDKMHRFEPNFVAFLGRRKSRSNWYLENYRHLFIINRIRAVSICKFVSDSFGSSKTVFRSFEDAFGRDFPRCLDYISKMDVMMIHHSGVSNPRLEMHTRCEQYAGTQQFHVTGVLWLGAENSDLQRRMQGIFLCPAFHHESYYVPSAHLTSNGDRRSVLLEMCTECGKKHNSSTLSAVPELSSDHNYNHARRLIFNSSRVYEWLNVPGHSSYNEAYMKYDVLMDELDVSELRQAEGDPKERRVPERAGKLRARGSMIQVSCTAHDLKTAKAVCKFEIYMRLRRLATLTMCLQNLFTNIHAGTKPDLHCSWGGHPSSVYPGTLLGKIFQNQSEIASLTESCAMDDIPGLVSWGHYGHYIRNVRMHS